MWKYNVLDFGAAPDVVTLQTFFLQAALDAASADHGATVIIPAGEYTTGTLNLGKASLYLEKGSILKGSPNMEDYVYYGYEHNEMGKVLSLLYSMENNDIRISGEGTIDLNGDSFYHMDVPNIPSCSFVLSEEQKAECPRTYDARPNQPIFFYRCNRVRVEDVRIINAPCWTMAFIECEDVRVTGLTIDNSLNLPNNDGMHFCGCKKVFVRECNISSGDDCIALSGITDWDKPCEEVVISNCILRSSSKAIVIGYMHSIVRNVTVSNCIILESNRAFCIMTSSVTGLVENVLVNNVRLDTRVRAGNWWGNGEPVAIIATRNHNPNYANAIPDRVFPVNVRNIRFQNLICTGENAIGLVGENENIQDVHFSNISMSLKDSKNLAVKGRLIDASPGAQIALLPPEPCWMYLQEVKDISVQQTVVQPYHGMQPILSQKNCRNIHIS